MHAEGAPVLLVATHADALAEGGGAGGGVDPAALAERRLDRVDALLRKRLYFFDGIVKVCGRDAVETTAAHIGGSRL
jgi:hypothetical protein